MENLMMKFLAILTVVIFGNVCIAKADAGEKARIYNFLEKTFGSQATLEIKACVYGCMKGKTTGRPDSVHQMNVDASVLMTCLKECTTQDVSSLDTWINSCPKSQKDDALFQCLISKKTADSSRVPASGK